jgi:hypothetical protein
MIRENFKSIKLNNNGVQNKKMQRLMKFQPASSGITSSIVIWEPYDTDI